MGLKVISLGKNVQKTATERQQGDSINLSIKSKGSLESLVLLAIEKDAFPGAVHLFKLCNATETLSKKLADHDKGKLAEEEIFQSVIGALNFKEDALVSYRHSLVEAKVDNSPNLTVDELKKMHGALECLGAGLDHYVQDNNAKAGLQGISSFKEAMSDLVKNRLTETQGSSIQ